MINQILEAEGYLRGDGVSSNNLYRACYMIARLLRQQGKSNIEIRNSIFDWANNNGLYIEFNLNKMLYHAANNSRPLRGKCEVRISREDIQQIDRHFDSRVTKRVALAMLCYAKATADKNGDMQISSNALGTWVGISPANLRGKYLKELCDFEYVLNVTKDHERKKWRNGGAAVQTSNWYRINVPYENTGEWVLDGNDINGLFKSVYG